MEKYFYLKADKKMAEGSNWSFIPKLMDEFGATIKLMPTTTSIEARHLVWRISDCEHNRTFIRRYYNNFIVSETNPETEKKVKVEAVKEVEKPETVTKEVDVKVEEKEDDVSNHIPTNPADMKVLKAKIMAELDEAGIPYSKNSNLRLLRELQKKA